MNVLWVFAHPEPRSLNGSLMQVGADTLRAAGHDVVVSDLYAMGWNPVAGRNDIADLASTERLHYPHDSKVAYVAGTLTPDIVAEQQKLIAADCLILQFPLWWASMPAILKGWVDRVYANGFAYGARDPKRPGRPVRFGEGAFAGKRGMLVVTASNRESHMSRYGVVGDIDDILYPINHGIFWYTGMVALPPAVNFDIGHGRVSPERYDEMAQMLAARMANLETTEPIPYRLQNSADYDDDLVLRNDLSRGRDGFCVHLKDPI